jgi:hypothetical protein
MFLRNVARLSMDCMELHRRRQDLSRYRELGSAHGLVQDSFRSDAETASRTVAFRPTVTNPLLSAHTFLITLFPNTIYLYFSLKVTDQVSFSKEQHRALNAVHMRQFLRHHCIACSLNTALQAPTPFAAFKTMNICSFVRQCNTFTS